MELTDFERNPLGRNFNSPRPWNFQTSSKSQDTIRCAALRKVWRWFTTVWSRRVPAGWLRERPVAKGRYHSYHVRHVPLPLASDSIVFRRLLGSDMVGGCCPGKSALGHGEDQVLLVFSVQRCFLSAESETARPH